MSIEEYNNLKWGDKIIACNSSGLLKNNTVYTVVSKKKVLSLDTIKIKEVLGHLFHYKKFEIMTTKKVKKNIG